MFDDIERLKQVQVIPDQLLPRYVELGCRYGYGYRVAHYGHLGRVERRLMSAIELCQTAALGGHVEACQECSDTWMAFNSCGNERCPKYQRTTSERRLTERQADPLPVPHFHVLFTVLADAAEIAFRHKAIVSAVLFDAVVATLNAIAADRRHLGVIIANAGRLS